MQFLCGFVCVLKFQFAVNIGHNAYKFVVLNGRRLLRDISVDQHSYIVRFAQTTTSSVTGELFHLTLRETDVELGISVSRNYRSFHRRFCAGVIGAEPLQSITLRRSRSIAIGGWLYKAIARYSIRRVFSFGVENADHLSHFVFSVSSYRLSQGDWRLKMIIVIIFTFLFVRF